ncbi:MAG: HEAT repeat domain-containing protein [Thermoplasmatota archaeon]
MQRLPTPASREAGYESVDPAPPRAGGEPTAALRAALLDASRPMFERMRCVFTLRNRGGKEAVEALTACFGDPSALLRHEVAYVLGQMGDEHAIPALTKTLEDAGEHVMVRHECAEALGAIGNPASIPVLERFVKDPHPEVSESCVVALDLMAWLRSREWEYAPR